MSQKMLKKFSQDLVQQSISNMAQALVPGHKSQKDKQHKAKHNPPKGKQKSNLGNPKITSSFTSKANNLQSYANPVSVGYISSNSQPISNIRLPFRGSDIGVYLGNTTADGLLYFGTNYANAQAKLLISPAPTTESFNGVYTTYVQSFGNAIRDLGFLHKEYKIESLRMSFVPILPTTVYGNLAFGVSNDPWTNLPPDMSQTLSYSLNALTSAYLPASMDLSPIVGQNATLPWYYIPSNVNNASGEEANAQGRLTSPGAVLGRAVGLLNTSGVTFGAGTLLGILRFEGVINFRGLCPFASLPALSHSKEEEKSSVDDKKDVFPPKEPIPPGGSSPSTNPGDNPSIPTPNIVVEPPDGYILVKKDLKENIK